MHRDRRFCLMLIAAALLAPSAAMAHGTGTGPNGGQLQHMEGRHFELKVEGRSVTLFLLDMFNKPLKAPAAQVRLLITANGKSEALSLRSDGGNAHRGESELAASSAASVVATVVLQANAKPIEVRYGGAHARH